MTDPSITEVLAGSDRFEVRRRLGGGGFGSVYEVVDRQRNEVVALKVLERADPHALYLFKQEFRTLASLRHPNLVRLYELFADGETWYFTMELVRGQTFLSHLRDRRAGLEPTASTRIEAAEPTTGDTAAAAPPMVAALDDTRRAPDLPVGRLRAAMVQLVEGVAALHAARILHRDLKPSNVLVTPEGRVVLLDFGLVRQLSAGGEVEETVSRIVGTPAYMCPEQAMGGMLTTASDWYSVGVMLYEGLTDQRPPMAVPLAGHMGVGEVRPPQDIAPGVPEALASLAMTLLCREAEGRPTGEAILEALGGRHTPVLVTTPQADQDAGPFVGRKHQLALLDEAARATDGGSPVVALVHARSGHGKTALVRRWLGRLRLDRLDAVVLRGRCYERESVPYKVLDALIDDLARYLQSLRPIRAEALLPADIQALQALFPVLGKVRAIEGSQRRTLGGTDRVEVRRRAFRALRELLANVASRHPVVLFVDDLQWGDDDSVGLLDAILRPPGAPPLMMVGTFRSDEAEASSFLQAWRASPVMTSAALDVREIPVSLLTADERSLWP